MKYIVRMEFTVKESEFAEVEIEADSEEDAASRAVSAYHSGELYDLEYYAGGYHSSEIDDNQASNWVVRISPEK